MSLPREVRITIGKRSYEVVTLLDDGGLERLKELLDDACPYPDRGIEQENLLMLTCLRLAYSLDKISTQLPELLDKLRPEAERKNKP